jgi:hypothetical protein
MNTPKGSLQILINILLSDDFIIDSDEVNSMMQRELYKQCDIVARTYRNMNDYGCDYIHYTFSKSLSNYIDRFKTKLTKCYNVDAINMVKNEFTMFPKDIRELIVGEFIDMRKTYIMQAEKIYLQKVQIWCNASPPTGVMYKSECKYMWNEIINSNPSYD